MEDRTLAVVPDSTADENRSDFRDHARALRVGAFGVAGLLLAAIAATPVTGSGLSGLPGVVGSYVPVGDLVVDAVIIAIAVVVTTARPRNLIGWLLLGFA